MKSGDTVLFFGKKGTLITRISATLWEVDVEGEAGTLSIYESEMVEASKDEPTNV